MRSDDAATRTTLLRAAGEVFAERGRDAEVDEIALRAGVSKGAFYQHFENKEAALGQLLEGFFQRIHGFIGPPSSCAELPEGLSGMIEFLFEREVRLFDFLWTNRALMRALPTMGADQGYLARAFRVEIDASMRAWVEHWRREGIYRDDIDAELATVLVFGAYQELWVRVISSEQRPPIEEWIAFAGETFCRAFGTPEAVALLDLRPGRSARPPSIHPMP